MPAETSIFDPSKHGVAKAHYVHTRENGRLASTTTQDIDAIIGALKNEQKIVLHFHGGLVPEENGTAAAASLLPVYSNSGAYPVFFIWRSGLMNVLVDNFREIAGEGIFKQLEKLVTKFVVGKLTARDNSKGLATFVPQDIEVRKELARKNRGEVPYSDVEIPENIPALTPEQVEDFRNEVLANPDIQAEVAAVVREYLPATVETSKGGVIVKEIRSYRSLMTKQVVDEIKEESDDASKSVFGAITVARLAVRVFRQVIGRFIDKRDHGIYPTIAEEILRVFYLANAGERIWTVMKDETRQTFEASHDVRGGRYFMDGLAEVIRGGASPQITLVGHSAGAVFVNNLLNHFDRMRADPDDPFPVSFKLKNVIFLAPACTFSDFQHVIEKHDSLFENFRMFTMDDAHEASDKLVPVLYPRSLLYLISGILEKEEGKSAVDKPIVGMNRYYVKRDVYKSQEVKLVREFVESPSDRSVWSPGVRGPGLSSGALHHHLFDEDEQVRESMRVIIAGA